MFGIDTLVCCGVNELFEIRPRGCVCVGWPTPRYATLKQQVAPETSHLVVAIAEQDTSTAGLGLAASGPHLVVLQHDSLVLDVCRGTTRSKDERSKEARNRWLVACPRR